MEEIINNLKIEDMIYEIRGKQVMLDSDLAKLYQVLTGNLNKSVKRNIERFPENFMFQLTYEEYEFLKFQNGISNNHGGTRKLPYVFTEQGIAMLAGVLHSTVAVEMSVLIKNTFVKIRRYVNESILEQKYINHMVLEHDNEIKLLKNTFLSFKEKNNEIYFEGQIYDAYSKIVDIFKIAKKELIINNDAFHDRYFILDNEFVYHCGASINYIGYKTFSITKLEDILLNNP